MKISYDKLKREIIASLGLYVMLASLSAVCASSLPKPTGKILLTVTGNIEVTNADSGAQFDYEMLSQLGMVDKNIATQWTGNNSVFTGVLTREIMELVGAKGTWVRATAANDYSVNIPLTDLTRFETMLAVSKNGERMTLRDKGPLWLLYPNDSRPDNSDLAIKKRMVWQLESLQIQ